MNAFVFTSDAARDTAARHAPGGDARRLRLRAATVAVVVAAVAIAWSIGDPDARLSADPELATLLRGMAVLKAMMVVAAFVALLWRFGQPIAPRVAGAWLASLALMAGATAEIWQLTALLPSAILFHVGLVVALVVAWRGDDEPTLRRTAFD